MNDWMAFGARSTLTFFLGLAISCLATGITGAAEGTGNPLPLTSPVSLLDLMRASVEVPADGIWAAQGAEKLSDDDWLLADQDSVSLAAAATLIARAGTGKNDRQWVSKADWQAWARDVQKTALVIRAAAKTEDQTKFSAAADHLTEVCQACHTKYRPEAPSDGVARYPFYPKRELAK
jgi:Cytochrome C'